MQLKSGVNLKILNSMLSLIDIYRQLTTYQ